MGPTLDPQQFVKEIAFAAPVSFECSGGPGSASWRVLNVDADYDDESRQTEISFEVEVKSNGMDVQLNAVSFQATIITLG